MIHHLQYLEPTDYLVIYKSITDYLWWCVCACVNKILFLVRLSFCQLANSRVSMILPSFLTIQDNPSKFVYPAFPFTVISTALSFFWFGGEDSYVHSLLSQETKPPLSLSSRTKLTRNGPNFLIRTTRACRHLVITRTQKLKREACSYLGKVLFFLFVARRFQNRVKRYNI